MLLKNKLHVNLLKNASVKKLLLYFCAIFKISKTLKVCIGH